MKTEQIIETLQDYNDWRRGKGKWSCGSDYFDTISPHTIGHTIYAAIERMHKLEQERDDVRQDFRKHIVELEQDQKYWKQEASRYKDRVTNIEILIEQMKYERNEARQELKRHLQINRRYH